MTLCFRILSDMNRRNIKIHSRFICIIEKSIKNYKKVYAYEKNGKELTEADKELLRLIKPTYLWHFRFLMNTLKTMECKLKESQAAIGWDSFILKHFFILCIFASRYTYRLHSLLWGKA